MVFQLKEKFTLVHKLKGMSGMGSAWSDEHGMNIQLQGGSKNKIKNTGSPKFAKGL